MTSNGIKKTIFGGLALQRDITIAILHFHRGTCKQNMESQVCSKLHLQVEHFASVCPFSFQIRQQDLIV